MADGVVVEELENTLGAGQLLLAGVAPKRGRREFRARLVRAGRIRRADGKPGPFVIPAEAIETAVLAGLFNGLAVFVDHPGWLDSSPSIKGLVGVTRDVVYNEETQSADGVIRFYNAVEVGADPRLAGAVADLLDMMLQDAAQGVAVPDVGISLTFWPRWKPRDNFEEPLILAEFRKIDTADVVFYPAADGRILEALSAYSAGMTRHAPTGESMPDLIVDPAAAGDSGAVQVVSTTATAAAPLLPAIPEIPVVPAVAANAVVPATPAAGAGVQPLNSGDRPEQNGAAWLRELQSQVVHVALAGSGLPLPVQQRLARGFYATPQALSGAIEEARQELAQLVESQVIHLPGGHPRGAGSRIQGMQVGMDYVKAAVEWYFGASQTPPPYNMRRFDEIYVALTGDVNFTGVFDAGLVQLAGASPTTLPGLAVNAMNKVVSDQFSRLRFWRWYELVTVVAPNDGSLHDMQWITYGGTGNLPTVADGAPYTEGELGDAREADPFEKRGRYVGITRKMIKNSDIQRIQAVPRALAVDAVRTRSAKIAGIFTQNSGVGPTLDEDGVALFHANHNNVATTALGTDTTAWEAASKECFGHTEPNSGKAIAVFAKYLLVPDDLYFQGLKNFGYGDGNPTTYNPFAVVDRSPEDPRPVVLVVPDWTDATDWAYLADPMIWPVIMMSYSQSPGGGSHPAPELFVAAGELAGLNFTNDEMPVKVRDEWAAGVNGAAGIGKRNVA